MKLSVCLEGTVAGILEGDGARSRFAYSTEWLKDPGAYPLSQSMPTSTEVYSGRRVLNFLWGLLPDNARILDTWARWFHVSARNPVALLAHVGEDCPGAVQFVRDDRLAAVLDSSTAVPQIERLSESQLTNRIRALLLDGSAARTEHESQFSLAGAQAKIALYFDARRNHWGIPSGRTPTTHILKPVANDFEGFAENEHFCLTLARRLALPAARTEWTMMGDVPTLIVERFDRRQAGDRWYRVHQEDYCQALGVHPEHKYENQGGPGFPALMSLLNSADDPEADRTRLMKGACLSYLLAATDMHAKNFSLLYSRGERRPAMRLAPFYDLASIWPYSRRVPLQKAKLAMRIGGHYRLREITPRHFQKLALACGYPAEALLAMLDEFCTRLPDEAVVVLKETIKKGMARPVLTRLVDALASQCRAVQRQRKLMAIGR